MLIYNKKVSISPLLINNIEYYSESIEYRFFGLCVSKVEYVSLKVSDMNSLLKKKNKIMGFANGDKDDIK